MTVTVDVPAVVGVPVMVPLPEIDVPAGSPDAVNVGVWPLAVSAAETGTDTAVPADTLLRARAGDGDRLAQLRRGHRSACRSAAGSCLESPTAMP